MIRIIIHHNKLVFKSNENLIHRFNQTGITCNSASLRRTNERSSKLFKKTTASVWLTGEREKFHIPPYAIIWNLSQVRALICGSIQMNNSFFFKKSSKLFGLPSGGWEQSVLLRNPQRSSRKWDSVICRGSYLIPGFESKSIINQYEQADVS